MIRVLYLTPWYPSERDAMSGLFVQKHAEAVRAQGAEVRVLHSQGWRDLWSQWRVLQREGWMPDIVQLNVIQKQGLLALWLNKRYGIPYVIVEHWSGYLSENGQFRRMFKWQRQLYRRIAASAEIILPVSRRLMDAMHSCRIYNARWGQIDNVVDDCFFAHSAISHQPSAVKTLIHVSCFDERSKNVKGLLRAAKMLSEKRRDWRLVLVGTGTDYAEARRFATEIAIPDEQLLWTGELAPNEVAEWMHRSDALVLSSRYETYGVVLAEAAAAGLPILSTPVGIAEEVADLIVPHEIAQNKPGTFAEFIESMLWGKKVKGEGGKEAKSEGAKGGRRKDEKRYTAEAIGKKLKSVYDSCLYSHI